MRVLSLSPIIKQVNNFAFPKVVNYFDKPKVEFVCESVPENLQIAFERIKNKEGKRFVKAAYKELIKNMDLQGVVPKKLKFVKLPPNTNAKYDDIYNRIYYSKDAVSKNPKSKQIGTLEHELTHCKQSCDLIRSSNISIEKYAAALAEAKVHQRRISYDKRFWGPYLEARRNGNGKKFISDTIKSCSNSLLPDLKKGFAQVLKLPKIKGTPERNIYLNKNLEAIKSHINSDVARVSIKHYLNNFREKEAFEAGNKMENYYKAFEEFCNRFSRD